MENNPTLKEIEATLNGYTEQPIINHEATPKSKRGRKPKNQTPESFDSTQENIIQENPTLTGELLVVIIDLILPSLIAFAGSKITKKKIKVSKLQMTQKQKDDLSPIADKVAKEMGATASPLTLLVISLLAIYAGNFLTQTSD